MLAVPHDIAGTNRATQQALVNALLDLRRREVPLRTFAVTGSRVWRDWRLLFDTLNLMPRDAVQFNGLANGADGLCRMFWTRTAGEDKIRPFPARWRTNGRLDRGAGVFRNTIMMEHMPQLVLGFLSHSGPSRGTRDALRKAHERGIPTFVFHEAPRHGVITPPRGLLS
jgi:hypothetical protein